MKILVFEDSPAKMQSLEELLNLKLNHEFDKSISLTIREDDTMLESDLATNQFSIVLIDDDLGDDLSGNYVIEQILAILDSTPESKNIPLVYYSAGTSVTELKEKSSVFGKIPCVSFENLGDYIYNYIKNEFS
ncbi:MAG: hypothetical protein CL528_07325 [Aequorivita sp.]|nr:hypothetical protein [Aequorivita sp.]MBP41568.1 hypothetical protein [Aequorivita sp.]HBC05014.1 hypothetical protein [Aequorivita sp.]|tara:strand:+ start:8460 stop:8858 length:399 start_codon:yes stop_codon:yes gene_type:complete